jgi:hypothetical protein
VISVGAVGEFHNKQWLQELAFQVGGNPTVVNISIAEHLHPQFAFRVAQVEGGRRFPAARKKASGLWPCEASGGRAPPHSEG